MSCPDDGQNRMNIGVTRRFGDLRPTRRSKSPLDYTRRLGLSLGLLVAILTAWMGLGAATAGAASEIERIWSFNGGEVAIHRLASGKFEGVVVSTTTFDECPHQVGEPMWTGMTRQSDGSYWGFHQWLFQQTCVRNPTLGPTAWRVLPASSGTHSLEVCFSEPGSASQPTIAPSGIGAGATFGCKTSEPTGLLPEVVSGTSKSGSEGGAEKISFAGTVILPRSKLCVRRGVLVIKLRDPKRDPLKELVVRIKRRKLADIHGVQRLTRPIVLHGLPSGSYTLKLTATTVLGQKLSGKRAYHSCRKPHRRAKVHRRRHRRG